MGVLIIVVAMAANISIALMVTTMSTGFTAWVVVLSGAAMLVVGYMAGQMDMVETAVYARTGEKRPSLRHGIQDVGAIFKFIGLLFWVWLTSPPARPHL